MFKPSAPHCSRLRLRLTTKQVNKGYYKGNRTGSMGAHTPYGGYVIDWRKVRTYVCPEPDQFKAFKLTPFVTKEMEPTKFIRLTRDAETGELTEVEVKSPDGLNGRDYLMAVNESNPEEIEELNELGQPESEDKVREAEETAAVYFERTWDDLQRYQRKRFGSKTKWEEKMRIVNNQLTNWYGQKEAQVRGKGLGGPRRTKFTGRV